MGASEDDDCLDDPIQLVSEEIVFKGSPNKNVIEIDDSCDGHQFSCDRMAEYSFYGKSILPLSATFFNIPRNIMLLDECRALTITLVDFRKHHRHSVDKMICKSKKSKDKYRERMLKKYEIEKIIALNTKKMSINFKKNTGLVGLKVKHRVENLTEKTNNVKTISHKLNEPEIVKPVSNIYQISSAMYKELESTYLKTYSNETKEGKIIQLNNNNKNIESEQCVNAFATNPSKITNADTITVTSIAEDKKNSLHEVTDNPENNKALNHVVKTSSKHVNLKSEPKNKRQGNCEPISNLKDMKKSNIFLKKLNDKASVKPLNTTIKSNTSQDIKLIPNSNLLREKQLDDYRSFLNSDNVKTRNIPNIRDAKSLDTIFFKPTENNSRKTHMPKTKEINPKQLKPSDSKSSKCNTIKKSDSSESTKVQSIPLPKISPIKKSEQKLRMAPSVSDKSRIKKRVNLPKKQGSRQTPIVNTESTNKVMTFGDKDIRDINVDKYMLNQTILNNEPNSAKLKYSGSAVPNTQSMLTTDPTLIKNTLSVSATHPKVSHFNPYYPISESNAQLSDARKVTNNYPYYTAPNTQSQNVVETPNLQDISYSTYSSTMNLNAQPIDPAQNTQHPSSNNTQYVAPNTMSQALTNINHIPVAPVAPMESTEKLSHATHQHTSATNPAPENGYYYNAMQTLYNYNYGENYPPHNYQIPQDTNSIPNNTQPATALAENNNYWTQWPQYPGIPDYYNSPYANFDQFPQTIPPSQQPIDPPSSLKTPELNQVDPQQNTQNLSNTEVFKDKNDSVIGVNNTGVVRKINIVALPVDKLLKGRKCYIRVGKYGTLAPVKDQRELNHYIKILHGPNKFVQGNNINSKVISGAVKMSDPRNVYTQNSYYPDNQSLESRNSQSIPIRVSGSESPLHNPIILSKKNTNNTNEESKSDRKKISYNEYKKRHLQQTDNALVDLT